MSQQEMAERRGRVLRAMRINPAGSFVPEIAAVTGLSHDEVTAVLVGLIADQLVVSSEQLHEMFQLTERVFPEPPLPDVAPGSFDAIVARLEHLFDTKYDPSRSEFQHLWDHVPAERTGWSIVVVARLDFSSDAITFKTLVDVHPSFGLSAAEAAVLQQALAEATALAQTAEEIIAGQGWSLDECLESVRQREGQ